MSRKEANRLLAFQMRAAGLVPNGTLWEQAKANQLPGFTYQYKPENKIKDKPSLVKKTKSSMPRGERASEAYMNRY